MRTRHSWQKRVMGVTLGLALLAVPGLAAAFEIPEKQARTDALGRVFDEVVAGLGVDDARKAEAREAFEAVEKAEVRRLIV